MSDISSFPSPSVAWIAGVGASAGLGAALGRRFAREGYTVVLTGRTAQRVEAVAAEICAQGGRAHAAAGDVTSEQNLARIAQLLKNHGTLRSAIFNAGNAVRAPTLELEIEQFESAWRINVLGGFVFARDTLPLLLDAPDATKNPAGAGSLLFTGATASLRGLPPSPRLPPRRQGCAHLRKASRASLVRVECMWRTS